MASEVSFSSKVEYRAVIRYLYLKGKTGQEIHCELTNVYGSSAPSYAQVKCWVGEFKRSRTSLEDETRSGRPSNATDEEICNKVRDLVYSDRQLTNVYGSSAPSYAQVKCWVGEFQCSRTSLEDETRSGRPSNATDEEIYNKVRDLVYSDRRIKVEEIANALHISHGSVLTTLYDRLGMHKLTALWVPKSLSASKWQPQHQYTAHC